MSIPTGGSKIIRSLTDAVLKWRSDWTKRKLTLNKLSELNYNAEAEIARMASELGLPSAEINAPNASQPQSSRNTHIQDT